MTVRSSRWNPLVALLLLAVATVVGLQACGVAIPLADEQAADEPTADAPAGAAAESGMPPTVTIPPPGAPVSGATSEGVAASGEPTASGAREPSATGTPREPTPESSRRARVTPPIEPPADRDLAAEPTFTPFTVAPSILNRSEVVAAMEAEYPPLLRDAGIGGTIRVYFFIDENGTVQGVRIDQSSGHQALDQAALSVAGVYRFSPALNRDQQVPVWVSFPITFQTR